MKKKQKVGVALGSGSARGYANIGVLKVLEEAGIPVDCISGCSMGALVGAFYASGMRLDVLERLMQFVERRNWVDFTLSRMGLISGNKIEQVIYMLTRKATFADLKIPLSVVAVDLRTGEKVVFQEGIVARAVRASISIPGYFVPVEMDGRLLVDGALLDRVPVDVVRDMGADFIIAVDPNYYSWHETINSVLDVITCSFDIALREITRQRLQQADVLIAPDMSSVAPSQFEKAREAIEIGERAARKALPQIESRLESRGLLA